MVEANITPEHIMAQLKAFYTLTEAQLGIALPAGSAALKRDGNVHGTGTPLILANLDGRLHLLFGFTESPNDITVAGKSRFRGSKHIVCFGHRGSDMELPFANPIAPEQLFKAKRANWPTLIQLLYLPPQICSCG